MAGGIGDPAHCRQVVTKAANEWDRIDILVNNAPYQATFKELSDISDVEWEDTFRTNIHSMFYLVKAALPYMPNSRAPL